MNRLLTVVASMTIAALFCGYALPYGAPNADQSKDRDFVVIDFDGPITEKSRNVHHLKTDGKRQAWVAERGQNYKLTADSIIITMIDPRPAGKAGEPAVEGQTLGEITGNLKFANPTTTVTAGTASADFDRSKVVFTGQVRIVSRQRDGKAEAAPVAAIGKDGKSAGQAAVGKETVTAPAKSESPAEPAKNTPTIILCEQFEFDYDTRLGTASGKLKIEQGKRTATAERAVFDDAKNIVSLDGNVEMDEIREGTQPDKVKCKRITIIVDEENWKSEEAQGSLIRKRRKPAAEEKGKAPEPAGKGAVPSPQAVLMRGRLYRAS